MSAAKKTKSTDGSFYIGTVGCRQDCTSFLGPKSRRCLEYTLLFSPESVSWSPSLLSYVHHLFLYNTWPVYLEIRIHVSVSRKFWEDWTSSSFPWGSSQLISSALSSDLRVYRAFLTSFALRDHAAIKIKNEIGQKRIYLNNRTNSQIC